MSRRSEAPAGGSRAPGADDTRWRQTLLGMGYTRVTNAGGYEELKQKSATRP